MRLSHSSLVRGPICHWVWLLLCTAPKPCTSPNITAVLSSLLSIISFSCSLTCTKGALQKLLCYLIARLGNFKLYGSFFARAWWIVLVLPSVISICLWNEFSRIDTTIRWLLMLLNQQRFWRLYDWLLLESKLVDLIVITIAILLRLRICILDIIIVVFKRGFVIIFGTRRNIEVFAVRLILLNCDVVQVLWRGLNQTKVIVIPIRSIIALIRCENVLLLLNLITVNYLCDCVLVSIWNCVLQKSRIWPNCGCAHVNS